MASPFLILTAILALALSATADDNNYLLSGEILASGDVLSYRGSVLVMQEDCNLVLYNNGRPVFQSNTNGVGSKCTLTLDDHGKFVIRSRDNSIIWTTPDLNTRKGNYAAVIRPDGQVFVYGPKVFMIPETSFQLGDEVAELRNTPRVNNLLFSGQSLFRNEKLITRDYVFAMRDDCSLVLEKSSRPLWKKQGNGVHCFFRLNHKGQIAVVDDQYNVQWSYGAGSDNGEYVLILQPNGQVVVYGPAVWSTASGPLRGENNCHLPSGPLRDEKIAMVTRE